MFEISICELYFDCVYLRFFVLYMFYNILN